jgi:hypothetical protein
MKKESKRQKNNKNQVVVNFNGKDSKEFVFYMPCESMKQKELGRCDGWSRDAAHKWCYGGGWGDLW